MVPASPATSMEAILKSVTHAVSGSILEWRKNPNPPMEKLSHVQCCCPVYKARTRYWDAATPTCRMRSPKLWWNRAVPSEHPGYPTYPSAGDSAGHASPWEQQLRSQTEGPANPVSWASWWPKVDVQGRVKTQGKYMLSSPGYSILQPFATHELNKK